MKEKGQVIFKGKKVKYEIDEDGYIYVEMELGKVNINQDYPLKSTDNIAEVIYRMLISGGY